MGVREIQFWEIGGDMVDMTDVVPEQEQHEGSIVALTFKQQATIQAALAFWQVNIADGADGMKMYVPEVFHPFFDSDDPLTSQEIAELQDQLKRQRAHGLVGIVSPGSGHE